MRSTPSAVIPAIAATATVKSALAAAVAASSSGVPSVTALLRRVFPLESSQLAHELSSSIPSGKGASMRSKRVRGADEGESDPGWDVGRLASQPSGLRAASSMLFFLAPVLTDTAARVMKAG